MVPVWLLGGFGAPDVFYKPLAWWLGAHHIHARVLSSGPTGANVHPLAELPGRFEYYVDTKRPTLLVGHSLGGIQAAWLAHHYPSIIGIVTMGSPLHGCPIPWFQDFVKQWIAVSEEQHDHFLTVVVPSVSSRLLTLAATTDPIAPPSSCQVVGARNVVLHTPPYMVGETAHLSLPYWDRSRQQLLTTLKETQHTYEDSRTRA